MGDISREVVPSQDEETVGPGRKVDDSREVLDGRAAPSEIEPGAPELAAGDRFAGARPGVARVTGAADGGPDDRPADDADWEPVEGDGEPADTRGDAQPAADPPVTSQDDEPAPPSTGGKSRPTTPLPDVPPIEGIDHLSRVLLTLLLAAREGSTLLRLAQSCDVSQKAVAEGLDHLAQFLTEHAMPLELSRSGDHVRLLSSPEAFPYLQRLRGVKKTERLSQAALETLAVIAYRQPVIRAEIEAIRGVKAGPILRTLLDHKLVAVTGRADVPGRPLQYGTTQEFLERFGLSSLKDLPSVKEFKQLG